MNSATYLLAFSLFAQHYNPHMPVDQVERLAALNWGMAKGNQVVSRRLAAKEAHECTMRLAATVKDRTDWRGMPRTDYVGGHYDLLAQEAHRLGILPTNNRHTDDFDRLKEACSKDPTLGTFIVLQAYIKKLDKYDLDRCSHWWQSGKLEEPDPEDGYLSSIWQIEAQFDTMVASLGSESGAARTRATKGEPK